MSNQHLKPVNQPNGPRRRRSARSLPALSCDWSDAFSFPIAPDPVKMAKDYTDAEEQKKKSAA